MALPSSQMIRASRRIGNDIGEDVLHLGEYRGSDRGGFSVAKILSAVTRRIDEVDSEVHKRSGARDAELGKLIGNQMEPFLRLLGSGESAHGDRLTAFREQGDANNIVPVDVFNPRALASIDAMARNAKDAPTIEVLPRRDVAQGFFGLFTLNFWAARRSVGLGGRAKILYTVDSQASGYQLEYWPQFLYSPVVFGASLTRPVSATIPVNHYRFQGWINNNVTRDTGLYFANAANPNTVLRAF
jgi:hypothetical protein